jgi:hypothetical protein
MPAILHTAISDYEYCCNIMRRKKISSIEGKQIIENH